MTLALDNTVGGSSSNTYVSQAEADSYFEGRINSSAWTSATSGNKDIALVNATSRLDHEIYVGAPTTVTQRLQWPRYSVLDENYRPVLSNIIPKRIKEAVFELALVLLGSTDIQALNQLKDFQTISVGSISLTPREMAENRLPDEVRRLIAPLIKSGRQATLERG